MNILVKGIKGAWYIATSPIKLASWIVETCRGTPRVKAAKPADTKPESQDGRKMVASTEPQQIEKAKVAAAEPMENHEVTMNPTLDDLAFATEKDLSQWIKFPEEGDEPIAEILIPLQDTYLKTFARDEIQELWKLVIFDRKLRMSLKGTARTIKSKEGMSKEFDLNMAKTQIDRTFFNEPSSLAIEKCDEDLLSEFLDIFIKYLGSANDESGLGALFAVANHEPKSIFNVLNYIYFSREGFLLKNKEKITRLIDQALEKFPKDIEAKKVKAAEKALQENYKLEPGETPPEIPLLAHSALKGFQAGIVKL